jgi:hypothetical protein
MLNIRSSSGFGGTVSTSVPNEEMAQFRGFPRWHEYAFRKIPHNLRKMKKSSAQIAKVFGVPMQSRKP